VNDGQTGSDPPLNEPLAADSICQPGVCSDTYNQAARKRSAGWPSGQEVRAQNLNRPKEIH